jgi:hypothetical protein
MEVSALAARLVVNHAVALATIGEERPGHRPLPEVHAELSRSGLNNGHPARGYTPAARRPPPFNERARLPEDVGVDVEIHADAAVVQAATATLEPFMPTTGKKTFTTLVPLSRLFRSCFSPPQSPPVNRRANRSNRRRIHGALAPDDDDVAPAVTGDERHGRLYDVLSVPA